MATAAGVIVGVAGGATVVVMFSGTVAAGVVAVVDIVDIVDIVDVDVVDVVVDTVAIGGEDPFVSLVMATPRTTPAPSRAKGCDQATCIQALRRLGANRLHLKSHSSIFWIF